jgi:long-chain acyl-CoA synthetase
VTRDATSEAVVIDKRPRSLVHMFLERVEDTPAADAYYYPVEGGWQESTWSHTRDLVEGLAAGLVALGVRPEDRVALMLSPRYEWVLGYLAVLWAGGAVTAIDPAASDETIARVLTDSGARVVLAEDYESVHMLWRIRAHIREVAKVVQVDGDFPDERVLTLEGLLALGHEHLAAHPRALSQRLYAVRRDGLAALAYVPDRGSGALRGVRISHAALTYQATALTMLGQLRHDDLVYVPLPFTSPYALAVLGGQLAGGFPLAVEGRPDHAVTSLRTVRPTVVVAAPSLLEQVRARAEREGGDGRMRRRTTERALETARIVHEAQAGGEQVRGRLARRHRTLDRKVLSSVRGVFGDRLRFVVVAGGGADADLTDYFELVGVTVVEAYARPEAGLVSLGLPDDADSRTAGRPLPGTEVTLSHRGEIEVRGPGVSEGYLGRRHDDVHLLERGWLHTGDAGVLDAEGRLRVLGRLVDP